MAAHLTDEDLSVPQVSIVIGTLDRCELLGRAIRSILDQGCDPRSFEIVVVDNGSKDRTRQVVEAIMAGADNVRYLTEPRLGLSIARNRGIAESRGPIIGFFDDDGTAEPGWLAKMLELFRQEPDIGAAGGLIKVAWPQNSQPEWMPMDLQGYYAGCDYGKTRRYLDFPQYPYGPNMMIRRSLLDAIGGFNEQVGPKGQNIMSAGELDLFQRLYERPIKVVYEPTAVVHHWVPAERATRKWLLRRAYKHGFSSTRMKTVSVGRTRLAWLTLMVRALFRSGLGCLAGTLGAAGRAAKPVVTSRYAHMTYWGGVARGSLDGVLRGSTLAPAPR
jgi:glycosyltransferase involved in cell wall biosynthesis